jgi:hypothetical protein
MRWPEVAGEAMRRRDFIKVIGGGAATWPLAARAQERERVRRIGVLMGYGETDPEAKVLLSEFNQGLAELGWRSGRNLRMDIRWTPGNVERKYPLRPIEVADRRQQTARRPDRGASMQSE